MDEKEVVTTKEVVKTKAKKEKKPLSKRAKIFLSIGLAVVIFFCGGATCWLCIAPEFRSLIKAKLVIDNAYYEEVTDDEFFNALFNAVNNDLLDEYSYYLDESAFDKAGSENEGQRAGIGLTFLTKNDADADDAQIYRVLGNSPAERAGIMGGDVILAFGLSQTEMQEESSYNALVAFLNTLDIKEEFYMQIRQKGEEKTVVLCKETFVESYVFYRTQESAYRFEGKTATTLVKKGMPLSCLDEDTAYIRLTQFNGAAAEEFGQVMGLFREQGKKNLLLDLRGNGGGLLDIMQEISSYFCRGAKEKRPLVAVADYGERKQKFKATGNVYDKYFSSESKIRVLADNETASAAEALIGCMLDYGTIGYGDICLSQRGDEAKTFGKGIMQTTIPLLGGDAIKLTTAKICWPISGDCIHGRGILPEDGTITVPESAENDVEIAAAVEIWSN